MQFCVSVWAKAGPNKAMLTSTTAVPFMYKPEESFHFLLKCTHVRWYVGQAPAVHNFLGTWTQDAAYCIL